MTGNISVRCFDCDIEFITSLDSYQGNESCCPKCGYGNLREVLADEFGVGPHFE